MKKYQTGRIPEAARRLLDDLPSLVPDDPALAAVIAEAMAAEFSPDGRARTPYAPQNEEITQADAERIYEEMMSK